MVKITEKLSNLLLYNSSTPEKKRACNEALESFSKSYFIASESNCEFKKSHAKLKKSFESLTKSHYLGRSRIGKIYDPFLHLFGKSEKQTFEKRIKSHMGRIVVDEINEKNKYKSTWLNRSPVKFSNLAYKLSFYDSFNLIGKSLPKKLKKEFIKLREEFLQAKTKNASECVYKYLRDNPADKLNKKINFSDILENVNFETTFSKKNQARIDHLFKEADDFIQKSKEITKNTDSVRKKSAEFVKKMGIESEDIREPSVFAHQKVLKEGVSKKFIDYLVLQHSNSVMTRIHRIVDRILSLFGMSILQRVKRNLNQRTMYSPIYTWVRLSKYLHEDEVFCEQLPAFKNLSKWCIKEKNKLSDPIIEKIMNCLKDFRKNIMKEIFFITLANVKKDTSGGFQHMKKNYDDNFVAAYNLIPKSFFKKQNVVFKNFFTKIKKEAAKN